MKKTWIFVAAVLLVTAAAAPPAFGRGCYFGGGIEPVSLGDDLKDVDTGSGLAPGFGYRFHLLFATRGPLQ